MSLATPIFYLNGKSGREPINWRDIKTRASFVFTDTATGNRISESNQPSIDTDTFIYTGIGAQEIIAYRKAGLTGGVGIFEGMPVRRDVSDGVTTVTDFDGYIDFKRDYQEISPIKVRVTIKELDGLNSFDDRARVNTFEFLASAEIGVFKKSDFIDIPFIVEPLDREGQLATLQLSITMFVIQGAQLVKEIFKDIAIIVGLASTVTGIPGSLVLAVITLGLDILFLLALIKEILRLLGEMARLLVPRIKLQKGMFIKDLLEKAIDFFGYKFETGIDELATTAYMPAKGSGDNVILSGVPKIGEPGETVSKLINIALRIGNARIGIIDDTVHIRTDSDPFWIKNSTFVLQDVGNSDASAIDLESEFFMPNTNEMQGTTVLGFATDSNEQWTLEDDEGIDVQAIREPIVVNDPKMVLINGFEDIRIPMALASRKSELSEIEELFQLLQARLAPLLIQVNKIFGNQIGANLNNVGIDIPPAVGTILSFLTEPRLGVVKLSSKSYSVPKLVLLENIAIAPSRPKYRIPQNHRDILSALPLYNKYYLSDSFADTNPIIRQRKLFRGRKIPFTFADLLKLRLNSYFATHDGKRGKMEFIEWQLDADEATANYWIEEQYTDNITETLISTL